MKAKCLLLAFFFCQLGLAQDIYSSEDIKPKRITRDSYFKLEISVPIRANQNAGEVNDYGEDEYWFLPDGVNARFGIGLKLNQHIAIGGNFGVDWKARESLWVAPLYGTVKVRSKIKDDVRVFAEPGLGRAMEIGSNQLAGYFKKISVGIESEMDGVGGGLYLEFCQYGFIKNTDQRVGSVCLGLFFMF